VTRRAGRATALAVIHADSERRLRRMLLPGRLSVPAVAYDATPSGITPDGRKLVLITPRRAFPRAWTSFAIVDTRRLRIRRMLRLRGDFSFDAISRDGRTLYLIHYPHPERHPPLRGARLRPARGEPASGADRGSTRARRAHERPARHARHEPRRPLGVHAVRRPRVPLRPRARHRAQGGVLYRPRRPRAAAWQPLGREARVERRGACARPRRQALASIDTRTLRVSSPGLPSQDPPPATAERAGGPRLLVLVPTVLLTAAGSVAARGRSRRRRARA
jgi:hypothetical protein